VAGCTETGTNMAQVAMWSAVAAMLDGDTRAAASALHGQPDPAMAHVAVTSVRDLLLKLESAGLQSRRDSIRYARKQARKYTEDQIKLAKRKMAGL
jgi:hypothetical protein